MSDRHEAPTDDFEIADPVEDEQSDIAPGAYVDEVPEEEPPQDWDAEDVDDPEDETEPVDTEFDDRR